MEQGTAYIKRAVLDIVIRTADAEATHHAYEDIISNALQQELGAFIENEIQRLIPDDRRIVIDSLSIDIGTITAGETRSEFVSRFRNAFPAALLKALPEAPAEPGEAELVRYFLQHGFYPWWASHAASQTLQELVSQLSPTAFTKLAAWIGEQRQQPGLLKRLFAQLDKPALEQLTDTLTGGALPALQEAFRQYDAFFTPGQQQSDYLHWIGMQLQQRSTLPATTENWERLYIEHKRLELPAAFTASTRVEQLQKITGEKTADALPEKRLALLREMLQQETSVTDEPSGAGTDALYDIFRYFFSAGSLPPGMTIQEQESFMETLLQTVPLKRPLYLRILNEGRTQPERLLRFFYQASSFRDALFAAFFPLVSVNETKELFRVLYESGMAQPDTAMFNARVLAAAAFGRLRQLPQNNGLVFAQNIRPFLPAALPPRAALLPALENPALAENIKNAVTALLRLQEKEPAETFFSSDHLFLQLPASLQQELVAHYAGHTTPLNREAFFSSEPFRSLPQDTQQKLIIHFTADAVTPAALYHAPVFQALPEKLQAVLKEKLGIVPDEEALQLLNSADFLSPFPEAVQQQVRELAAQLHSETNSFYHSPAFNALPENVRWELRALPGAAASPQLLLQQVAAAFIKRFPVAVQQQLQELVRISQENSNAFFSAAFFRKLPEKTQRDIRNAFRGYPEPAGATAFLASPAFTKLNSILQQELVQALQEQRVKTNENRVAENTNTEREAATKSTFAITDTFLSDLLQHYMLNEALPWWTAPLHHHAVFRKLFAGGVAADPESVFSAALHHFARYFPVAFGNWSKAAIALPQLREYIFARLAQPDFERVSAALFPAVWPDVPQTIKLLFPFFTETGTRTLTATGLRDVVAALLPFAGEPPKTVMVQVLRLLGSHFGKSAEAIQLLLHKHETLPAVIQQAAAEWAANASATTEEAGSSMNEPLRFQNAAVALPLSALLNGEAMLPALSAPAETADALLLELDENPSQVKMLMQTLRRQPELIPWLTGILPEKTTAQLIQKLLVYKNTQLQESTALFPTETPQRFMMRMLNDVIAESRAATSIARQHAHAYLLQELLERNEEKRLPAKVLSELALLLQQPAAALLLGTIEKSEAAFAETAVQPFLHQVLIPPGVAGTTLPEQIADHWKSAVSDLLHPFIALRLELEPIATEKIATEAAQLLNALQQQATVAGQTKQLQHHTLVVLQFLKVHISQRIALAEENIIYRNTTETAARQTKKTHTKLQTEAETAAENKSQTAAEAKVDLQTETERETEGKTDLQTETEAKADLQTERETEAKTDLQTEREAKADPQTETAVDSPTPPGREAVLRNPVFFINSLLYFFTWKKLPWWSPYKSADELNAYAAAVVRERQGQLMQQLQMLLEKSTTQHEMVVFLSERLQETDFGSAALSSMRLRFELLQQVAHKTDDALAAFIRTGSNLLQLPLFNEPENGQPLAEKLYTLLLEKLQQQNTDTPGLLQFTADEREAMLQRAGYTTTAADDELTQAIAALEQQLQEVKEDSLPASDAAKINTTNQALIRPLLEQLQPVLPESMLQQLPDSFVNQLSQYPQQERRTAWLAAVFTFFALHTGRSLRDVLNPAIRLSEKQSGELHQELLTLRQRPAFPYPGLLLEAELQALALQVNPGESLPFAVWREAVTELSSDAETQRLLLLTFAITETAQRRNETAEQVAAQFAAQLQHTGPEQEQLLHTPGLLRTLREHLYLLDTENRNVYTDTILQLKNRQAEARSEQPAPVAARIAAALLQQLVRDKHLLQALGEQETKKYSEAKTPKKADEPIEYVTEKPAEGDPIYVFNAGLVLLWPFIGGLFRRLGYVSGKTFVSQEKRERAVLLLQYVIDEQHTHPPEHLLPLNKLLCGMHPTDPIEHMADLDETEKQEAVAFLAAVKAQWEQMKNTSIDTFRRTFLKREGALVYKNDNWELQVQHIAVDVLLKKLPWGVSTVKFAWTPTILFVKWKI
jgi:hypothetical protein